MQQHSANIHNIYISMNGRCLDDEMPGDNADFTTSYAMHKKREKRRTNNRHK